MRVERLSYKERSIKGIEKDRRLRSKRVGQIMLKVAVAGVGWWGRTIVGFLQKSAKLRAVMLVDPNREAAGPIMTARPSARWCLDELASKEVQGVILCTPHTLHCSQIVATARAGKHVFCEKPLAMSREEVVRAIAAVEEHKVALGVGHERRFDTPVLELEKLVANGRLGTLLHAEANLSQDKFLALPADNWRLSSQEAPAGPMTATGIHMLDMAVHFLGAVERVHATVRTLGSALSNGDTLAMLLSFKSGASALISGILATPFVGRFALYGSHGWAELLDKEHPETPEGWIMNVRLRGEKLQTREFPPVPTVLANLEAFADAALGHSPYPIKHDQMRATICAGSHRPLGHGNAIKRSGHELGSDNPRTGYLCLHADRCGLVPPSCRGMNIGLRVNPLPDLEIVSDPGSLEHDVCRQYFSAERWIARSTCCGLSPLPVTMKWKWILVKTWGSSDARSASMSTMQSVMGARLLRRMCTTS
jgi:predicted dehydrogenase